MVSYQIGKLPNFQITKLLVTKLLITKLSSYQIISYQKSAHPNATKIIWGQKWVSEWNQNTRNWLNIWPLLEVIIEGRSKWRSDICVYISFDLCGSNNMKTRLVTENYWFKVKKVVFSRIFWVHGGQNESITFDLQFSS